MLTRLPAGVAGWVDAGRVGRLGTSDALGQPLVVPICYAFDGEAFFSAIDAKPKKGPAAGLKRIRNIRENPKVSLVIDHYEEDWRRLRYVIIQGMAEVLSSGSDYARAVDLLTAKYQQYRELALDRDVGTMIKLTPTRVIQWASSS